GRAATAGRGGGGRTTPATAAVIETMTNAPPICLRHWWGIRLSSTLLASRSPVILLENLGGRLGGVAGAEDRLRLGRLAGLVHGRQFHDGAAVGDRLVAERV